MSSDAAEKHLESLVGQLLLDHDPAGSRVDFLGAQYDLGLAWVHFDEGFGLSLIHI